LLFLKLTTLKENTFKGIFWSFIDVISGGGISFIIGIFLARLLAPSDFGLIGIVTVFLAFSNIFVDSGFSTGLIRKKQCNNTEYNTVFWFNIAISLLIYILIFLFASPCASFFNEIQLKSIIRVLGFAIIIDSFSIVQRAVFIRQINFKIQAIISLISSLGGGIIGLSLAFHGFGVWSLVLQIITRQSLQSCLLWYFSMWSPSLNFSLKAFHELFNFGSKILLSNIIITLQNNIYYFIIGKFFSSSVLGYYTRAEQFNSIVTNSLTGTMDRVFFPVLATLQDNEERLKNALKRTLISSFFISYLILMVMAIYAKSIIYFLIGPKWNQSVIYLQLFCIGSIFYPFNVVNANILKIKGRSDLILKLQVIKIILTITNLIIGILWGISALLLSRIFTTLFATIINSLYSGKLIGYQIMQQLKDIFPYFRSESIILLVMFGFSLMPINSTVKLFLGIISGAILFYYFFETKRHYEYIEIKSMIYKFIKRNNQEEL